MMMWSMFKQSSYCSGFRLFWLDPFNGPVWEIVNLSHVWNTSIQYNSPEREKVVILAYIYFYNE